MHSHTQALDAPQKMNREQWLEAAVNELRPFFKTKGYPMPPKVYVSVGWPISGGRKRSGPTIGQAWSPDNSADKVGHVFVSPILAESTRVLDVLVHELGHIVVGVKHGHRAPFVRFCKAVGLEGKPTATEAGDTLKAMLTEFVEKIGEYPHAALAPGEGKVQTTRLLKVICPDCGYTIRVTQKWIDEGYPTCPCGSYMCDPDMIDGADTLKQADSTIGYTAHNGRFDIRYVKHVIGGRISSQKWLVTDWHAHAVMASTIHDRRTFIIESDHPEITTLATRDDVLGFIEAVMEGVYKYSDEPAIDEPELEDGEVDWDDDDERDYLTPDEIEDLDNPDDDTDDEHDDRYPTPDEDEPIEVLP